MFMLNKISIYLNLNLLTVGAFRVTKRANSNDTDLYLCYS